MGKRRLSKRERKNLKRIKKSNDDGDGTAPSLSAGVESASPSSSKANVEWTLDEYMVGYNPTTKLLKDESSNANDTNDDDNVKSSSLSLGKWFPKAAVIKSSICYTNDYLAKLAKERRRSMKNALSPTPKPKKIARTLRRLSPPGRCYTSIIPHPAAVLSHQHCPLRSQ
jgi:hypothetical protein